MRVPPCEFYRPALNAHQMVYNAFLMCCESIHWWWQNWKCGFFICDARFAINFAFASMMEQLQCTVWAYTLVLKECDLLAVFSGYADSVAVKL